MYFNSDIFASDENLFKYMDVKNIAFQSANTNSTYIKCSNKTSFINIIYGYKNLCMHCQRKQTCLEKYGDENYNNKDKMLQTKIDNDSYVKMIETHKATCLRSPDGVEFYYLLLSSSNAFVRCALIDS